jgi:restriction endonuclease S subunit
MSFNQGVTGLIPSDLVNAKFFAFLLMQMEPEISRLASGSTFPEVSRSRLKKLKVRIPTRTVQDQAVNMIEHVQALVKHLRADEDLARMFRRTTLNALIGEPNVH